MNWWKIVFALFVAAFGLYLGFLIISYLSTVIWFLFVVGILGLGGYAGYKYFTGEKVKEIEGNNAVSQAELENAKIINEIEELKRRLNR